MKSISILLFLILPFFCFAEGQSGVGFIIALMILFPLAIGAWVCSYILRYFIKKFQLDVSIKLLNLGIGLITLIYGLYLLKSDNII